MADWDVMGEALAAAGDAAPANKRLDPLVRYMIGSSSTPLPSSSCSSWGIR